MALDNNRKFKIYIKSDDDVNGYWYEIGNNGKTILSTNYGDGSPGPATLANEDVGMKINTTTTFTANDGDEMCIISHNGSGSSTVNATGSNHRILKLKYALGISPGEANYKLKLCQSDIINLGKGYEAASGGGGGGDAWDFYELAVTGNGSNVPIGGPPGTVTEMTASGSSTSIDTIINILKPITIYQRYT